MTESASPKGKTFTPDMIPQRQRGRMNPAQEMAWAEAQTARYRIVAIDPSERADRQAIIAEELEPRILAKLSPKARRMVVPLLVLPPEIRDEVLNAFDQGGELRNPFQVPKA